MKAIYLLILTILSFSLFASASVKRNCVVKYLTNQGWSSEIEMEVEFATGNELDRRTCTSDYDPSSTYCLLWFSDGGVAIIKISTFVPVANYPDFGDQDFRNVFGYILGLEGYQVNSTNGVTTKWVVIAKKYASFIDPRDRY
jgi:hypothetical protein